MRKISAVLCLLVVIFLNQGYSQTFEQEWKFPGWLVYVGDLDDDNVGEFVSFNEEEPGAVFYDASSHTEKWSIPDKVFNGSIFSGERASVHPKYLTFPIIDFNGDGVKDIFFGSSDYKSLYIVDLVTKKNIFEWTDASIDWVDFDLLADVDGDGELELVFHSGTDDVGYNTYVYSTKINVTDAKTQSINTPNDFILSQNYPNPFNPTTTINYQISRPGSIKINIYDVNGRLVRQLINERKTTGKYSVTWDGKNEYGNPVASGNYFYQIVSEDFVQAKKMILLK